jgi:flagellar biosynthesis/type III secretory pathway protein FliH
MATRQPPRFVPTLTEVVQGGARRGGTEPLSQEQLVHRVMQRVDLTLDRRLREAIAKVVLEHTRQLGPAIRDEVEAAVRTAVSDALAEELDPASRPVTPGD